MNTKKIFTIIGLLALMMLMGFIGVRVALTMQHTERVADTVRVTVTDTIPYYKPVPKDSTVIRYVTRVFAVEKPAGEAAGTTAARAEADTTLSENYAQNVPEIIPDSVTVEIPITQKKYETEDYRAYVSGFEPNLDSIFLYRRTIKETVSITEKRKALLQDRFGFGVTCGAGYGIIHKQPDIFVGGAVYFRIW